MSFPPHGSRANSPVTCLFEGLFPNLFRYLSGRPKYTTKQLARAASATVSTKAQGVAVLDRGFVEEQGPSQEGITETTIENGPLSEQLFAPRFISPHPLVTFAEVPALCGAQSNYVVTDNVFDPKRPLFLQEAGSPSLKSSEVESESSLAEESFGTTAQAASVSQQSPKIKAESSSAEAIFDTPAQSFSLELSVGFDLESRKHLNRHSLPSFPISHSHNVSSSSNETLAWNPSHPSSTRSPVISQFGQLLKDAAEKIIGEKQADEVHGLEKVIEELRQELDDRTERVEELETDLELCERDRELNFNTALRLYGSPGNSVLVERRNLIDHINQLKFEVFDRDSPICSRDRLIEALRRNVARYANQEQWILLQQRYFALQQQYGQMPQDFKKLQRKYQDLEDEHIDVSNRFKKLEGDHNELKVERDQIRDERDQLEDDAQQNSAEAAARYWALEVQRDQIIEQRAESEKKAKANWHCLAELAARMFKRTIFMTCVLGGMVVDQMGNEQIALCELAYEHLGLDATEIANGFEQAWANGNGEAEEKRDESGVPESHAGDVSSSMSTPKPNNREPTIPIAGAKYSSMIIVADGTDVPKSPDTFDARREREVAAAEEEILGPLGLGFEDGSPLREESPFRGSVGGASISTNENVVHEKALVEEMGVGSDPNNVEDGAVLGGNNGETGKSRNEGRDEDNGLDSAVVLSNSTVPGGYEGGSDGETISDEQIATSPSTPANGKSSDIWKETSFGTGKQEQEFSDYQNPFTASPTAALKPESSAGSATFKSSPKTVFGEGSLTFKDLGVDNEAIKEEANALPRFPEEASNAPRLQDFNFGGSSGGVPFIGSEKKSSTLPEPTPEPASTGMFSFSGASLSQAPRNSHGPPRFEQDFNFGGSNGGVSFTASQKTSSSLPTPAPESVSTAASPVLGTSLAQDIPSATAQAEEKAPKEVISYKDTMEKEGSKEENSDPNMSNNKKAKGKKAKEEALKKEKPTVEGPNRNQRRAASRERKAADKKAQAVANNATQRGRSAVAMAMMRG